MMFHVYYCHTQSHWNVSHNKILTFQKYINALLFNTSSKLHFCVWNCHHFNCNWVGRVWFHFFQWLLYLCFNKAEGNIKGTPLRFQLFHHFFNFLQAHFYLVTCGFFRVNVMICTYILSGSSAKSSYNFGCIHILTYSFPYPSLRLAIGNEISCTRLLSAINGCEESIVRGWDFGADDDGG